MINFAGLKAVGESVSKPLEYYENNINGVFVLLDVMRRHGCKNIIFLHLRQCMEILPLSLLQKNVQKDNVQIHMDGQSLCSNRYL